MEEERMYDLKDLDGEIWKDIEGYEGYYMVSNMGRVKSLERFSVQKHLIKEKIIKIYGDIHGYMKADLYIDGKRKHHFVHRLVANAFMENKDLSLEINHIDEDKTNNCVKNLEWVTHKKNCNHGTRIERQVKNTDYKAMGEKYRKTVYQYTLDGEFIKEYESVRECVNQTGFNHGAITRCCRGELHKHKNFKWSYEKLLN